MIKYAIFRYNQRSERLRIIKIVCDVQEACNIVSDLQHKDKHVNVVYYFRNVDTELFDECINKSLIDRCKIVAQCLYLFDQNYLKQGLRSQNRARSFMELALSHARLGAQYL